MKKLLSILFAVMILLSGMHLSLATHLCGEKFSTVKISFSYEKASCGMCLEKKTTSTEKRVSTEGCCKDELSTLAVDNNYSPSTLQINEPAKQLLQIFNIPKTIGIQFVHTNSTSNMNVQPAHKFIASAVNLPDICVFRI